MIRYGWLPRRVIFVFVSSWESKWRPWVWLHRCILEATCSTTRRRKQETWAQTRTRMTISSQWPPRRICFVYISGWREQEWCGKKLFQTDWMHEKWWAAQKNTWRGRLWSDETGFARKASRFFRYLDHSLYKSTTRLTECPSRLTFFFTVGKGLAVTWQVYVAEKQATVSNY